MEEDLDEPIGRYFDLIAGTSTGGILAIGLALGIPAKTLLELYEDRGPTIFGQAADRSWLGRKARNARASLPHLVKPKHEASTLRDELRAVIGDKLIGEAETRLLIPAWPQGEETTIERTRRLLYVTCTRAEESLALVLYSEAPDAVRRFLISNKWMAEDEVVMAAADGTFQEAAQQC